MKKLDFSSGSLFNIDILAPTTQEVRTIGKITKLNIFSNGHEFDPDGLFSTTIYGEVGSKERNTRFGYIDLGIDLLHPLVYQHAISLNSLYRDIIHGDTFAMFDEKINDFVKVDDISTGETGLHFFIKHFNKVDIDKGQSDQRDFKIEMVKKYSTDENLIRYLLVLPAGLRDYLVKDGKPSEDEINDKYRAMLSISSNLTNMKITKANIGDYNPVIIKLQKIFLEIYLHFKTILSDKGGFIQDKWAKRSIKYGTRNVITPITKLMKNMDSENKIGFNDTVVGLYQYINGINPITKNRLNDLFLSRLLDPTTTQALLFNKETLKAENVSLKPKTIREWTTFEGLDSILHKLGQDDIRYDGVSLDNHYLILVKDSGDSIDLYFPGDNIENTKGLRPLTYMELFYIAIYDIRNKYPALLTRYPVTGVGSTYLTNIYVKTSVTDRDITLNMNGISKKVYGYPRLNEKPFNSISPHYTRLGRLGADHDGDTVSLNFLLLDDALKERDEVFNSLRYYISPNGEMTYSVNVEPVKLLMQTLTSTL